MTEGGGGRGVGGTTHARSTSGSLTGCVPLEVTGRKGQCAHAWALPSLRPGYLGDREAPSPQDLVVSSFLQALAAEAGVLAVGRREAGRGCVFRNNLLSTFCEPGAVASLRLR